MFGGLACLVVFVVVEMRVDEPMFRLSLFRIRAFTAGNAASFLGSVGRGGFQFHVDDLVPGHLATPARLQLYKNPVVGRYRT